MEAGSVKHKVYTQRNEEAAAYSINNSLIRQAVVETLGNEGAQIPCVVNILITGDNGIRKFNFDFRDIDSATDVLSFPMQVFAHSGWNGLTDMELDEDTGELPLGDIIISMESVIRQAEENKNSIDYETAYLIIHSTLHLLGYDHDNEDNERVMHEKSKAVIQETGI